MPELISSEAKTTEPSAQPGRVKGLFPRPEARDGLVSRGWAAKYGTNGIDSVQLIAGRGMEGDRYAEGRGSFQNASRGSHLTLIAIEDLEHVAQKTGIVVRPEETLRNVLTQGIDLQSLMGKRFRIGDALCAGTRICAPCVYLQDYLENREVIKSFVNRAGLRAQVLQSGMVSIGDDIVAVGDAEDPMIMSTLMAPSGYALFLRQEDGTLLCGECRVSLVVGPHETETSDGESPSANVALCPHCGMRAPVGAETRMGCTVRIMDDGPLQISGIFTIEDPLGKALPRNQSAVTCLHCAGGIEAERIDPQDQTETSGVIHSTLLCRCGRSATKPYCDFSHSALTPEFASECRAPMEEGSTSEVHPRRSTVATIRPSNNGPYVVSGTFTLEDRNGRTYPIKGERILLCRCGGSNRKPFCDSSHRLNGFASKIEAP